MQNFAAVIFDMDGLLLDSERLALETFQVACSKFEMPDLTSIYEQCIGMNELAGIAVLRDRMDGIVNFKDFMLAWEHAYRNAAEERPIPLKEGVEALLSHIEAMSTPMAVATSASVDRAKAQLMESGILDHFAHVVGGDQVTRSKPDPEIYLKAASILQVDPSKCLALEDSANGVKSAVAAGMTVVQVPDVVQPDEELLKLGHIVMKSLGDVAKYDFSI